MYTDDKNAQVVLALLKKFGIKKMVVSPGTTNVPIARSVQQDPFFEVYSVVDERGAAYFAGGLAFATGEPVVISCTGATASRDYLPGLTEAYYRKLPVIALTSQHHSPTYQDLVPQMTDRRVSQNDIKLFAADLPVIKDNKDMKACVQLVNKALHIATSKGGGPVHINLPVDPAYSFTTKELPDVQYIARYDAENFPAKELSKELQNKKVGIFIGSHKPFSKELEAAMNLFVKVYDAVVFYDHTSCYHGEHGILTTVAADVSQIENVPDVLIDMGSICGDYSASKIYINRKTWRLSEDGEFHNRYAVEQLEKVFDCSELFFFTEMAKYSGGCRYYESLKKQMVDVKVPQLPLSNTYVSSRLSKLAPKNSILHMAILNSLRNMDFFEVDKTVTTSSNVGGFGIDGALSTTIGQSMADKNKLAICLLGDLAFFYDMNALGIRHIGNNLRVLLINNGRGVEFRLNPRLESQWGSDSDEFIAASGHFGSAKGWAESMGFHYMTASDKESFDNQIEAFCDPNPDYFGKPVVYEVFTSVLDEQNAIQSLRNYNRPIK